MFKRWPEMEQVNVNGNCVFVKGEEVEELVCVIRELTEKGKRYEHLRSMAATATKSLLYSEIAKKAIGY